MRQNWQRLILPMPQSIMMPDRRVKKCVPLRRYSRWLGVMLSIGVCSLTVVACNSDQEPPIPVTQMSNILFDLQVAEDYSIGKFTDSIPHGSEKNADTLAYYYAMVLKHYNLSPEQLKAAMNWYYAHPMVMDSVYRKVLDKANKYKGTHEKSTAPLADSAGLAQTDTAAADATIVSPAAAPKLDRPARTDVEPADRTENEELQEIRQKNKDIKETLDKVKKQAQ